MTFNLNWGSNKDLPKFSVNAQSSEELIFSKEELSAVLEGNRKLSRKVDQIWKHYKNVAVDRHRGFSLRYFDEVLSYEVEESHVEVTSTESGHRDRDADSTFPISWLFMDEAEIKTEVEKIKVEQAEKEKEKSRKASQERENNERAELRRLKKLYPEG